MDLKQRSTAELVSGSIDDATRLLRKEAELLKVGIVETLTARLKGAGIIALAVLAVLPGLLFLIVGATLWLPFSPQADFVIVGALLIAVAGIGIMIGVKKVKGKGRGGSSDALERVKEDVKWARERMTP